MKRKSLSLLMLTIILVFGTYGLAVAGSGEPIAGCPNDPNCLPVPNKGPFISGTFTVARDQVSVSWYDVQLVLRQNVKIHLFSSWFYPGTGDLCGYTADELKGYAALLPCQLSVGKFFGFNDDPSQGVAFMPVIYDISIVKKDFCGSQDGESYLEMIYGMITIRLVPYKTLPPGCE